MAEMVRLTTESSHLKQEKERLQSSNEKMTEKAANLVGKYKVTNSRLVDSIPYSGSQIRTSLKRQFRAHVCSTNSNSDAAKWFKFYTRKKEH